MGRPEGRRPLGRLRRRWEDLKVVGWEARTLLIWLKIGIGSGAYACSNEPSGFIN
jgi:hypothetical protein